MSNSLRVLITGGSGHVGRHVVDVIAQSHHAEILDIKNPHRSDLPFHRLDLRDERELAGAMKGFDAVIHLAGIPHPLNDPAEHVFRTNALGTYNLLEACARQGVRKVIFMSSESTLGFAFSTTRLVPAYVPVDELHPTRPQDPYGLSKLACELLCAGFSQRTGMTTVCLRAPWIWTPEESERALYRSLVNDYEKWPKNLWACVHVFDVAQAIRLALENDRLPAHDVFFICADENWTGMESLSLMKRFYPETSAGVERLIGAQSLISNRKANRVLGFRPAYTPRDLLQ
jgi:UDP-glucose 4-epimerase